MQNWSDRFPMNISLPTVGEYKTWLLESGRLTPAVEKAFSFGRALEGQTIIYIAGGVTRASNEEKERYEKTAEIAGHHKLFGYVPHLYGTDPIKNPEVTPDEVHDIDYFWAVLKANLHVNFLHPVSASYHEEGWADILQIPTVYAIPEDIKISRLPRGAWNTFFTIPYGPLDDFYLSFEALCRTMREWLNNHHGTTLIDFIEESPDPFLGL